MVLELILSVIFLLAELASPAKSAERAPQIVPLPNAHAHNDYLHPHPLSDALDHGFTSVEADVFLVDGKLLVAHEEKSLNPERTLQALYLDPLAARVKENGGRVYRGGPRFILLVDIKKEPQAVYRVLREVLLRYRNMLTTIQDGKVQEGAVTVILTGARPEIGPADSGTRLVGLDGRPEELPSAAPAHFLPMISDKWSNQFAWKGDVEIPYSEREKLRELVTKAHAGGRILRFWDTPEKEPVWRELLQAGVDLINTDELAKLEAFLKRQGQTRG
jgi:glycerophosphoryl diester phosphodiesterase